MSHVTLEVTQEGDKKPLSGKGGKTSFHLDGFSQRGGKDVGR